jgi:putative hydrolase of the HAD superfamily
MKADQFETIIFDLGGVIIDLNYDLTRSAFEELGLADFQSTYSQFSQSSLFDDYETGKISSQRFINTLLPHLPNGCTANEVVHAWNAMIMSVPQAKIALLDKLRTDKNRIYLLSNTNEIHMQKVRREWGKVTERSMESFFDRMFLSYEIGLRKPDVEIFEYVCGKIGSDPGKVLFIDDSPQHIEGAKKAGLCALHLTDPTDLYTVFS